MIVCDTSGLYAAYNARQPEHKKVLAALERRRGPLVMSSYVLTELDYLLRTKVSIEAEVGLLRDVEAGAYEVSSLSTAEIGTAVALIERYSDRNLGLADAANVVLAARFRTNALLTLDERDYRVVKPVWGESFELVPVDDDHR
ncbi:MAG TPA: PIN domain-containing protein [Thermoanaerobaculia bacterium]|nr:PIN domain-containing protein [Thermoanaerobaculia bacterium]